jgi:hypothetical protein
MTKAWRRILTLSALAGAIPFTNLIDIGYRPWSFELIVVTLVFIAAGALAGSISARNTVAFAAVFVLACHAFADANIVESKGAQLIALAIVSGALLIWFPKIESWAPATLTAFAVTFSATSIIPAINAQQPAWARPVQPGKPGMDVNRPSVLHIVLDEMATPVVAFGAPGPDHPASSMIDDLASRGFQVHERADSSFHATNKSVSAIAGLRDSPDNFRKVKGGEFTFEVLQNSLFSRFADAGFNVKAVQFGYLKLCPDDPRFDCMGYSRGLEMNVFGQMGLGIGDRLKLAALALHKSYVSEKERGGIAVYLAVAKLFGTPHDYRPFSSPAVVLKLMDRIKAEVAQPSGGTLSFNHLLLPHFPYILDANCGLKPIGEWTYPVQRESRHGVEKVYAGYWDQVACAKTRLLEIIDSAAARENLYVIVHGDHGSRISRKTKLETEEDLLRTFLAIRGPGIMPGKRSDPIQLHPALITFYDGFLARNQ